MDGWETTFGIRSIFRARNASFREANSLTHCRKFTGAAIGSSLKNYALYRSYLGKLDQHSPTQMLRPFLESVYPYMHHILYVKDLPLRS